MTPLSIMTFSENVSYSFTLPATGNVLLRSRQPQTNHQEPMLRFSAKQTCERFNAG